jgi:hypothetical protein
VLFKAFNTTGYGNMRNPDYPQGRVGMLRSLGCGAPHNLNRSNRARLLILVRHIVCDTQLS